MAKTTKRVVFDDDAQTTVNLAIHALYAIRRLAILTTGELPRACGDAPSFCVAITEISKLHGKALDDCIRRVNGSAGIGIFDKEFIDYEEPAHG